MVAGPGPEKPRPLVDCRDSQRAEAPCASVNSEATSGSERSSRSPPSPVQFWFCLGPRHCHRFCSVWVPSMVVGSGSGSVWAPRAVVGSGSGSVGASRAVVSSGSGSVWAPSAVVPTVHFLHVWARGLPGWTRSSGVTGMVPLSAQCRKRACSPRAGSATRSPTTPVIRTAARSHRSPRPHCRRLIPK